MSKSTLQNRATDLGLYRLDLYCLSLRRKRDNILGWYGALPSDPIFETVETGNLLAGAVAL